MQNLTKYGENDLKKKVVLLVKLDVMGHRLHINYNDMWHDYGK